MSEETVREVTDRLQVPPRKSLRRLWQEIGVSKSTCQRAAKEARLHAYQFTVVHELKGPDHEKRMVYCRWLSWTFKCNDLTAGRGHGHKTFQQTSSDNSLWIH
jgi:hypothetical protein